MKDNEFKVQMLAVLSKCGLPNFSALADAAGVSRQLISYQVKTGELSLKVIATIDKLSKGTVTLRELRPDLYK